MVNLARFFKTKRDFDDLKNKYPLNGTKEEKLRSPLANSLRSKKLSVIRLDGSSIETSSNYDEIIKHAKIYVREDHGSVFAVVFSLSGELYACIESEEENDSSHVEINTKDNLEEICDAVYRGNGKILIF